MPYQVWVHPKKGDDFYYELKSKSIAEKVYNKAKKNKRFIHVEKPSQIRR